ncbi:hypothetical protein GCM10010869_41120 [Mesorhizobium tianshanense]|uniref:Uncharacterized protein n=1 Tax=Mesorhizobium tianshanense TaxID=39844 RepID=A0A562M9M1_9HYPH|nr:hypothetical protein [Mesorhizobium tianshanense]TWI16518.1 hypothetical protein IQ26_07692 [Mesorhizobium tianshanense]GLS38517.1 hypothetical protein GCM10010869_41120 [Mesorhizobium tianshanense]
MSGIVRNEVNESNVAFTEEARRNAEAAEQRLHDAAEAEAAKEAAGVTFATDEERQRFIRAKADERMDRYDERRAALPRGTSASADLQREGLAQLSAARLSPDDTFRSGDARERNDGRLSLHVHGGHWPWRKKSGDVFRSNM